MKSTINIGTYDEIIGQLMALGATVNELDMGRLRLHQFSTEQIVITHQQAGGFTVC